MSRMPPEFEVLVPQLREKIREVARSAPQEDQFPYGRNAVVSALDQGIASFRDALTERGVSLEDDSTHAVIEAVVDQIAITAAVLFYVGTQQLANAVMSTASNLLMVSGS